MAYQTDTLISKSVIISWMICLVFWLAMIALANSENIVGAFIFIIVLLVAALASAEARMMEPLEFFILVVSVWGGSGILISIVGFWRRSRVAIAVAGIILLSLPGSLAVLYNLGVNFNASWPL